MNEPAFPTHGSMGEVATYGMTLRDYFAAKAMQELLMHTSTSRSEVAAYAYQMADAMLAERNKK